MNAKFPVYEIVCRTARGPIRVPTFRDGGGRHRPIGRIAAPAGSELRDCGREGLKLKVPKPGLPGEFWLFSAAAARDSAIASADGLRWDYSHVGKEEPAHARS